MNKKTKAVTDMYIFVLIFLSIIAIVYRFTWKETCRRWRNETAKLEAELKEKNTAFEEIITESGKVDINNWPAQQQICQSIAQQVLKDKGGE